MRFRKKPHIYIEFGEKMIRYLAVDPSSQQIIEKDVLIFDAQIVTEGKITNPSLVESRLKILMNERKWRGAKTSVVLPEDSVIVREEQVPGQLTESEVKDYLALHMNQLIRSPFKQTSFHFEVLEPGEATQTILLLVYSSEVIHQYQELLENVGLTPQVADLSSLCLYRILLHQQASELDETSHRMVLQWHPTHNIMTVFHEHRPKFIRYSKASRLTELWDIDHEGRFIWTGETETVANATEIQIDSLERFMDFYRYSVMNGEAGITEIYLTGTFPYLEQVEQRLNERFALPIHRFSPVESLEEPYLTLYGLTMKEKKAPTRKKKKRKGA